MRGYSSLMTHLFPRNVFLLLTHILHATSSPCSHLFCPQRNRWGEVILQAPCLLGSGSSTEQGNRVLSWHAPLASDLILGGFLLFATPKISQTALCKPLCRLQEAVLSHAFTITAPHPLQSLWNPHANLTVSILTALLPVLSSLERKHTLTSQPLYFTGLTVLSSFPKGITWYSKYFYFFPME